MRDSASLAEKDSVTVVIATLGGPSLKRTIEKLNRGSVVPAEILVCIPEQDAGRVKDFDFSNTRMLMTNFRGQVAQRAFGFRHATHDFVMQLDDDMLPDEHCIAHLLDSLKTHGSRYAVAPLLVNLETGQSAYKKPGKSKLLQKIYYRLMNGAAGYQQGKIDKSGSPIGIDPDGSDKRIFDVEWLPGGCVMHHKENLILDNFYPFPGKAFCEDLIHSCLLRRKDVSLIVDSAAICRLELVFSSSHNARLFFSNLVSDFRARKYFMQMGSRGSIRMYLFYAASCVSYICKKIAGLLVFGNKPASR